MTKFQKLLCYLPNLVANEILDSSIMQKGKVHCRLSKMQRNMKLMVRSWKFVLLGLKVIRSLIGLIHTFSAPVQITFPILAMAAFLEIHMAL
ncbi:hypothetical protein CsSME_00032452 [Camellia sinensis var. sinensis]